MKRGADVAAPQESADHAAGRDRPMPEVLAEIRKANAAAMSPFGLPARGPAPQPAGPVAPAEPDRKSAPRQKRRTPSPIQREFYHYFNLKAPTGLSFEEALSVISDFKDRLSKDDRGKLDEWDTYVKVYSEINKPGVRKTYRIKKVSFSAYRAAIKQLKEEGQVWAGDKGQPRSRGEKNYSDGATAQNGGRVADQPRLGGPSAWLNLFDAVFPRGPLAAGFIPRPRSKIDFLKEPRKCHL